MESESLNRKPIEKYIWISISLVIGIPSIAVLVYFAIEYPKGPESRVFTGFEEICGEQYDRMFKCADVPVYVYVEDRSSLNYPRWVDFLAKYVNSWLVIFAVISIIIFIVQARKLWWRNKYDYLIAAAVIMLLFSNCFVDWSDHLP